MTPENRLPDGDADRNVERMLAAYGREPGRVQETVRRVLDAARRRSARADSAAARTGAVTTRRAFAELYAELRATAARLLSRRPPGTLLDAEALVHELYLDLAARERPWKDRDEFLRAAADAMHWILIASVPRFSRCDPGPRRVLLDMAALAAKRSTPDLVALDDALGRLEAVDERAARVVEFRLFGSLTSDEIASRLGVPAASVEQRWDFALRWLADELAR
jgi:RNA polymerase sigma factor (TIGR02999 family)